MTIGIENKKMNYFNCNVNENQNLNCFHCDIIENQNLKLKSFLEMKNQKRNCLKLKKLSVS